MSYKLEPMTAATWELISLVLPEMWRNTAVRQGWPEVATDGGIAFNESRDAWICRAPVFLRDGSFRWYFFHFEGETYCFRIESPTNAAVQFVRCAPRKEVYQRLVEAIADAFLAYGFYGIPDGLPLKFIPIFSAPSVGGEQ